jgi:hypothetical protein
VTPGTEVIGPMEDEGADIVPLPLPEQVREFIRASKAESTLRGYDADWTHFCAWCEAQKVCPLPATPEAAAFYIAECAGYLKVGSIQRRLNAIAEAHKTVGMESHTQRHGTKHDEGNSANCGSCASTEISSTNRRRSGNAGFHGLASSALETVQLSCLDSPVLSAVQNSSD